MVIRNLQTGEIVRVSRPLQQATQLFTLPPADTVVWKYGDYYKFTALFSENRLYFRRADQLPDIYEGKFTAANETRRSTMFTDAFTDLGLGDAVPILRIQESHRSHTFLNCWHKNERENPRMWREYTSTSESVVLVSKVSGLFAGTPVQCKGAEVHYVDEDEALPELHSLAALVHKRREPYAFEVEFRLLYMLPQEEAVFLDQPCDYFRLIPADPSTLVHQVRFHPAATAGFKARVCADIAAAGLAVPTRDSDFVGQWPVPGC